MQGCHRLRGRRAGSYLYLDVNIEVSSPEIHILFVTCIMCHELVIWPSLQDLLVSFTLQVDPFSSVSSAHDIGENVRWQIHKSHPTVTEMFIHIGLLDTFIIFLRWWRQNLSYLVSVPTPNIGWTLLTIYVSSI
jgi:divalent metal cation (Fe/Co/Zn/Cd) transporter